VNDGGFGQSGMPQEGEGINLQEYLWLIRRGKWIILAGVFLGLLTSFWINARTTPVYSSSASFIYNIENKMSRTLDMPGALWFEMEAVRNNQIHLIRSRSMAEMVADSILRSPAADSLVAVLFHGSVPPSPYLRNSLVGLVAGSISVSWVKDTDFFSLSAVGYSPEASAVLANLTVSVYRWWNQSEAQGENRQVRVFLESQLSQISTELQRSEDALLIFKEQNEVVDLTTETRNLITAVAAFETQASSAATEASAAAVRRDYLRGQLEEQRVFLSTDLETVNNNLISTLQGNISRLEASRAALLSRGADPESPAVLEIQRSITGYSESLTEAIAGASGVSHPSNPAGAVDNMMTDLVESEAQYRSATARRNALEAHVRALETGLSDLPVLEYELARLERNRTVSENIFILLRTKFEEIRIAEVGQIGNVTIIDTALPGGMIRPTTRRNLMMGLLVGLAVGVGVVFLIHQLDVSVRTPDQLEKLGIPVIGVIPRNVSARKDGVSIVLLDKPISPDSEAFRDLRTSLDFVKIGEGVRKVLVTSCGPQEGKSTTAANLAVAESRTGRKVLLVDCDLRRPMLHRVFGLSKEPGFTELVAGRTTTADAIHETIEPNLFLLPSGRVPHNPAELVGAASTSRFFDSFLPSFDMVIIDAPPVAMVTDAMVILPAVDTALLVAKAGEVNIKVLAAVWQKLERTGCHVAGAVLNGFEPGRNYSGVNYYTYRYSYSYRRDSDS
jgi:tyrosine-protein kinase Etk/Wzc